MIKTALSPNPRLKIILAILIFAVVFTALVVVATYYDLPISQILTKDSLEGEALGKDHGDYISYNGFGLFFEAIGSAPMFGMIVVACAILFWAFWRRNDKLKWLALLAVVGATVGCYFILHDLFKYTAEFIGAELYPADHGKYVHAAKELASTPYISALCAVVGLGLACGVIALWKRVNPETNRRMVWWVFAIVGTMACYLVVHFVKSPIGRVRFRTMNYLGDFSYYTPWYVINGKRNLLEDTFNIVLASDNCKSFPSGHTFSAGMVYTLLALPYLSPKCNKRWVKALLYCLTVLYTGLVALSRIVVGAHYMSDVLFGGTIAFLGALMMREIFVCRGSNLKALFAKAPKACCCCCHGKDNPDEHSCCCHEDDNSCCCNSKDHECHCHDEDHECCCHSEENSAEHSCCCHSEDTSDDHACRCHEDDNSCCCHSKDHECHCHSEDNECRCHAEENSDEHSCCCHDKDNPAEHSCCCHSEDHECHCHDDDHECHCHSEENSEERSCCCHDKDNPDEHSCCCHSTPTEDNE